jgi:type I restriction enzyme, R subunit
VSVIAWEYELVEKPFCQQLQAMGWEWIEGDPDLTLPSGPTGS